MKNFIFFPEYMLYKIAKNQNKHNRDILFALALLWVILKLGIILGVIVNFLTPYKLTSANLTGIASAVIMVIISTNIGLKRVSRI